MQAVIICDAFGWDYQQYISQPKWFIDLLEKKRIKDDELMSKATPNRP